MYWTLVVSHARCYGHISAHLGASAAIKNREPYGESRTSADIPWIELDWFDSHILVGVCISYFLLPLFPDLQFRSFDESFNTVLLKRLLPLNPLDLHRSK